MGSGKGNTPLLFVQAAWELKAGIQPAAEMLLRQCVSKEHSCLWEDLRMCPDGHRKQRQWSADGLWCKSAVDSHLSAAGPCVCILQQWHPWETTGHPITPLPIQAAVLGQTYRFLQHLLETTSGNQDRRESNSWTIAPEMMVSSPSLRVI